MNQIINQFLMGTPNKKTYINSTTHNSQLPNISGININPSFDIMSTLQSNKRQKQIIPGPNLYFNRPGRNVQPSQLNNSGIINKLSPSQSNINSFSQSIIVSPVPKQGGLKDRIGLVSEDINDTMENTKLEILQQLTKFQKFQKRFDMPQIQQELNDLKRSFGQTNEQTNKKREENLKGIREDFNKMKTHLDHKIDDSRNLVEVKALSDKLKDYSTVMKTKLDDMEKKQLLQIEQIQHIFKHSQDENLRKMSVAYDPIGEQKKANYVPHSEENINAMTEHMARQNERSSNHIISLKKNKEILQAINRNKEIKGYLMTEVEEKPGDNTTKDFKRAIQRQKTHVMENVRQMRKRESRLQMGGIQNKLFDRKFENYNNKPHPLSKLRGIVYAVIASNKIKYFHTEGHRHVKIASLKHFVDYFKPAEDNLTAWVRNSTQKTSYSIKKFENMNLDMSEMKFINSSSAEAKERYIKLQIRIKNLIESLTENISLERLGHNTLALIKIIITDNSFVPFRFFTSFELSRLSTHNGTLQNLSEQQKLMIVSFYIIVKILIKKVLIEEMNKNKLRVSKNYKTIASVLYHSVIQYFMKIKPKKNLKLSSLAAKQDQCEFAKGIPNEVERESKEVERSYRKALNKQKEKQMKRDREDKHVEEKRLLEIINPLLSIGDDITSDVPEVSKHLYSFNQIEKFFIIAKENSFDVGVLILNFTRRIISLVEFTD